MLEVEFIYNGIQTVMNSIPEEKIKYTCIKFADTIGRDINSILFIYNGQIVNIDFTFVQYMDIEIEKSSRMTLLVKEITNSAPTPTGNTIDISSEKYELRNKIDLLNRDIREIIKILNEVMDNMELFYKMKYENNINNINVSITSFSFLFTYQFLKKIQYSIEIEKKFIMTLLLLYIIILSK